MWLCVCRLQFYSNIIGLPGLGLGLGLGLGFGLPDVICLHVFTLRKVLCPVELTCAFHITVAAVMLLLWEMKFVACF